MREVTNKKCSFTNQSPVKIHKKNAIFVGVCAMPVPTKFYTGRLHPEDQPLTLLYTIFDRKGIPFVYLPLKNGTPFTYLLKNTASLF